jgi:membrane-bound serine protease (ClpP class)
MYAIMRTIGSRFSSRGSDRGGGGGLLARNPSTWAFLVLTLIVPFSSRAYGTQVELIQVKGIINPVISSYFIRAIGEAEKDMATCLVVELDTPGGLDESMRDIIQRMLDSRVPIVVYVYPRGARAASAGTFITLAADIAAMAPGTNIGAAHPVALGQGDVPKEMKEKVLNDAVAYIKSIAARKGRNVSWAERAVRKSISSTETEALKAGVIDIIAENFEDLLAKIHGRRVKTPYGEKEIITKGARVKEVRMGWREKLLHIIGNPNIAYLLMMIAIYGIIFELSNPGAIFPGVIGAISLILAFFAFQVLPISLAGLLLIILAIILFILEIKAPTHGALTIGGVISMLIGSLMLIDSKAPYFRISLSLILTAVAATTAFFTFAVGAGVRALGKKVVTGREGIVGLIGVAKTDLSPNGVIFVEGEYWNATSVDGDVKAGEKVIVVEAEGLRVKVKREGR